MIGFLAVSSQQMAPKMPMNASTTMTTMKREPNQSSSSPRSSAICMQPRPSEMSAKPT